jgi:hypothetical protein
MIEAIGWLTVVGIIGLLLVLAGNWVISVLHARRRTRDATRQQKQIEQVDAFRFVAREEAEIACVTYAHSPGASQRIRDIVREELQQPWQEPWQDPHFFVDDLDQPPDGTPRRCKVCGEVRGAHPVEPQP